MTNPNIPTRTLTGPTGTTYTVEQWRQGLYVVRWGDDACREFFVDKNTVSASDHVCDLPGDAEDADAIVAYLRAWYEENQ